MDGEGQRSAVEHNTRAKPETEEQRDDHGDFVASKGSTGPLASTTTSVERDRPGRFVLFYIQHRLFFHLGFWLLFTGWWIAGLVLHHQDKNWVIPFLLWLCITLRLLLWHVAASPLSKPIQEAWDRTVTRFVSHIPKKLRIPISALFTVAVILTGAFASEEAGDNTRANRAISLLGLVVFVFTLWITSRNRRKIKWRTVIVGMLLQFLTALFVLRTSTGYDIFHFVSNLAGDLLGFAGGGVAFLTEPSVENLGWFLVGVVPPIIFFVALVQLLYHYGFIQWFVVKFALFFWWSMGVSGAEAVAAAACPFIGQGENAVLIKPFIPHLTNAEIHQVVS